jgi:hypothetical protein
MGRVMTTDAPAPNAEIKAAEDQLRQIRYRLGLNISRTDGDLLTELAELDSAERDLRTVRDVVLAAVRRRGASWKAIEASTGTPATTWRGRHFRFTEEDQAS